MTALCLATVPYSDTPKQVPFVRSRSPAIRSCIAVKYVGGPGQLVPEKKMGCSPKNVQGERGGCKGAFIQTTVGTEAGDDRSDPHTFCILGDLRLEVECFPAGPLPSQRQGFRRARQIPLSYQTLALWWLEFFSQTPFFNEKVSFFPGKLHCLLSHSSFVLGGVRCQEAGGHAGDTLANCRGSQAGQASTL